MTDEQVAIGKAIATVAHKGQVDKAGAAYIDHPRRVAERLEVTHDPVIIAAGWLHDVVEDTDLDGIDLLAAGVSIQAVHLVNLLTRRAEVQAADYYRLIREEPGALAVKLADIADNTDRDRLAKLPPELRARLEEKYDRARAALLIPGAETTID